MFGCRNSEESSSCAECHGCVVLPFFVIVLIFSVPQHDVLQIDTAACREEPEYVSTHQTHPGMTVLDPWQAWMPHSSKRPSKKLLMEVCLQAYG